ncbi:undecaprenyl-phosphate glucose phosphotransferase [Psychrosphaera haliotis]|uniref:Undecaprenyl-phosphate glucose phosphotransferase n=1 Tax=Psychrosphaera haliotis TaxID=555083 RepID=A0A6N8F7F6_9GAMM|nr:undecaprenyl-phosphate glucose phosphotransferase [Psychrosphaera haliotis]MUH71339.1 undecaprenyl-phosphate glucose phosphotransferase [Psychrosphaera haliotis]
MKFSQSGILHNNQTFVSLMQRVIDIIVIVGSLLAAVLYLGLTWKLQHTTAAVVAVFLFHFTSELDNLYISWRGLSVFKELKKAFVHWFIASSAIFLSVGFVFTDYLKSQQMQLIWFFLAGVLLVSYRLVLRLLLRKLRQSGHNTRTVVIAGAGDLGHKLAFKMQESPSLGLIFKGFYDDSSKPKHPEQVKGNLIQLVADCKAGGIDRVYLALPMRAEERLKWLMKELADTTASVYLVPDIFTFNLLHSRSDVISGIPTISIYDSPIDGSNGIIKRIEDIVFASIILVMISPFLLAIGLAVKFTSKGPILFKQNRYGIDGKPIKVWKFRSMKVMEDGAKVTQATKNDSRLTPIGSFIRRTSLDELPQFFNVITGQMSIVGPRPHAVAHNEEYRKLIEGYMLRHKVKPGITGWAQINGWRGETDTLEKMEKRIEYDLEYIRNWSLWFDVKIIIGTVFKGFINKNAY